MRPPKRPKSKKKSPTGSKVDFTQTPIPKRKKTLVEEVLNERNLVVTPPPELPGKVVRETQHGKIRIEGEVTPEKLKRAEEFENIFREAAGEIMDLAVYTPDPSVLNFIKRAGLTQKEIDNMKNAPAWTVFPIGREFLMKTQDRKIESVKSYCYRLERAVLDQINLKNDVQKAYDEHVSTLTDRITDLQAQILFEKNSTRLSTLNLAMTRVYGSLKAFILKLLS